MRRPAVFALALLLAAPAAADTLTGGRFVARTGDFSIDMHLAQDQVFRLDKETSDASIAIADFRFTPDASFWGLSSIRTIEWFKLATPIAPQANDKAARDIVDGYLSARYAGVAFTSAVPRKARAADGRLYYVFEAKGIVENTPVTWRGAVLPFAHAIALVAQVTNTDAKKWGLQNEFDEPPFLRWAITLKPEK